jgi:hypothetical protein
MSLDIRWELTELADRARQYADAATVLRAVQRRRRRHLAASAAAVTVILLARAVVSVQLRPAPTPDRPAPAAGAIVPVLPTTVDPPDGPVPVLPTDHGVGRSALVYQPAVGGPAYLVAPDGTHYRVPITPVTGGAFNALFRGLPVYLSPDGRWLVSVGDDDTVIRDLTGSAVRRLGSFALPQGWSPDGRWLVYVRGLKGTLLNTESGQSWPLVDSPVGAVAVPGADGRVVKVPFNGSDSMYLQWSDPVHGRGRRSVLVGTGGALGPQETLRWQITVGPADAPNCSAAGVWLGPLSHGRLLVGVFDEPRVTSCADPTRPWPVALLVVTADSGQVTSRLRLPAGAGEPLWYGDTVVYPTQASRSDRIEFTLVTVDGHGRGNLTSLPAGAAFVLAGAAGPATGPARA